MVATQGPDGTSRNPLYGSLLLGSIIALLFAVPVLPQSWHGILHHALFTAIFLFAALSLDRGRNRMLAVALVAMTVEWISYAVEMPTVLTLSRLVELGYFIYIVIGLIVQIAKTRVVTGRVILESINGYLLLGIVFSVLIMIVSAANPEAFTMSSGSLGESLYHGFVTLTTLGYGDIVPTSPFARSVALGTALCGQIYLTVIIAMLVGKFLSRPTEDA